MIAGLLHLPDHGWQSRWCGGLLGVGEERAARVGGGEEDAGGDEGVGRGGGRVVDDVVGGGVAGEDLHGGVRAETEGFGLAARGGFMADEGARGGDGGGGGGPGEGRAQDEGGHDGGGLGSW